MVRAFIVQRRVLNSSADPTARGRVVVVHNDPSFRTFVREALAEEGFAVEAMPSCEAIGGAGRRDGRRPRVILIELYGDALAVRQAVAWRYGGGVPVVALTTPPSTRDGSEIGAAAVLPLPFQLDELLALVARFCAPH